VSDLKSLFPDCEISMMPQRSAEWHEIRKDKLTASQAGAWLAERPSCRLTIPEIKAVLDAKEIIYKSTLNKDQLLALSDNWPLGVTQGSLDAQQTAIYKILGNLSGCKVPDQWEVDPDGPPPRNPALWAVWNGLRLEKEAVAEFQEWSGEKIIEVGFAKSLTGSAGCSPDGLIDGKPIGFEGKAPLPATHVKYLLEDKLPDIYRDQVHFSMAVTGAKGWWFQSYCPGLPPFPIFIERDEYTERMAAGLAEFNDTLMAAEHQIASLWEATFKMKEEA